MRNIGRLGERGRNRTFNLGIKSRQAGYGLPSLRTFKTQPLTDNQARSEALWSGSGEIIQPSPDAPPRILRNSPFSKTRSSKCSQTRSLTSVLDLRICQKLVNCCARYAQDFCGLRLVSTNMFQNTHHVTFLQFLYGHQNVILSSRGP